MEWLLVGKQQIKFCGTDRIEPAYPADTEWEITYNERPIGKGRTRGFGETSQFDHQVVAV